MAPNNFSRPPVLTRIWCCPSHGGEPSSTKHPDVFSRISYVHDASFGAMRTFEGDMKKRERQDLINNARAQMVEPKSNAIPPRRGFHRPHRKVSDLCPLHLRRPIFRRSGRGHRMGLRDTGWRFIDKSGNCVIPPTFEWATSFRSGLAAVNRKKNCGYIEK